MTKDIKPRRGAPTGNQNAAIDPEDVRNQRATMWCSMREKKQFVAEAKKAGLSYSDWSRAILKSHI